LLNAVKLQQSPAMNSIPCNEIYTDRENKIIESATHAKIGARARILRFQQLKRGLETMIKLSIKAQAEFENQSPEESRGPIDMSFVRSRNAFQLTLDGCNRSIERAQYLVVEEDSKIAGVQRKARVRAGVFGEEEWNLVDEDLRNFVHDCSMPITFNPAD
jgi:hypothetical protein